MDEIVVKKALKHAIISRYGEIKAFCTENNFSYVGVWRYCNNYKLPTTNKRTSMTIERLIEICNALEINPSILFKE